MEHTVNAYYKQLFLLLTLTTCISVYAAQLPEWVALNDTASQDRAKDYKGVSYKIIFVGPQKYALPDKWSTAGPAYYNYAPKPDDVILVSYPRAGHNWLGQLIWLLQNNIDVDKAKAQVIEQRVPLLEATLTTPGDSKAVPADSFASPRTIRTQLPFSLIPTIASSAKKIIFLARNPKDVMVSDYKWTKQSDKFVGTIEKYWSYFQQGLSLYAPYWAHLKEGLSKKSAPNVLVVFAEDQPERIIANVTKFLDRKYSQEELDKLSNFMFRNVEGIDQLSWNTIVPEPLNAKMNTWIKENIGDITFPNQVHLYQ